MSVLRLHCKQDLVGKDTGRLRLQCAGSSSCDGRADGFDTFVDAVRTDFDLDCVHAVRFYCLAGGKTLLALTDIVPGQVDVIFRDWCADTVVWRGASEERRARKDAAKKKRSGRRPRNSTTRAKTAGKVLAEAIDDLGVEIMVPAPPAAVSAASGQGSGRIRSSSSSSSSGGSAGSGKGGRAIPAIDDADSCSDGGGSACEDEPAEHDANPSGHERDSIDVILVLAGAW